MPRMVSLFSVLFPALILALLANAGASAQTVSQEPSPLRTSGTLVVVPAFGEVRHVNDEAIATFMVEEQDKDRTAAVNRVNRRMKEGSEIIKREDPAARLETRGYHTYPIYADEGAAPRNQQGRPVQRQLVGWRVGQTLEVKTRNIDGLPKMVAAAQRVLALNGLHFGLSESTMKMLEERRIAAAYANLIERVNAIAKAMGRKMSDVVLEVVDFEGSGNYVPEREAAPRMLSAKAMDANAIEEPSFEPGETTLSMQVVGRARFQ